MGKGDIKTKKGKINAGSYGNSRKRKVSVAAFVPKVKKVVAEEPVEDKKPVVKKPVVKKAAAKKDPAKKTAAKKEA